MSSMVANKGEKKHKIILIILFVAYLVLLFYFLFFSESMGRVSEKAQYRYNLTLFQEIRRFYKYRDMLGQRAYFINIFGNVLAFVPFGYFVPKLLTRFNNWIWTILYALEFSFIIEVVQLVFKLGCFDVDDIFLNTVGGFLGYMIYFLLDGRQKHNVVEK